MPFFIKNGIPYIPFVDVVNMLEIGFCTEMDYGYKIRTVICVKVSFSRNTNKKFESARYQRDKISKVKQ